MTAAELAAEWRERVARIARNLTDFNDSEACLRVKARMDAGGYDGATRAAARAALDALDALWRDYLMLSRVVDDADALVKRAGVLNNHAQEAAEMLTGPSIKLPAVSVPVQRRGLLDRPENETRLRPQAVLDSMIAAFETARSAVAEIDAAERDCETRAAALVATRDEIAAWAAANGVAIATPPPAPDAYERDPLAARAALAEAEASLAALKAERETTQRALDALDRRLAAAQSSLDTLAPEIAKAEAASAESARRFEGAAPSLRSGAGKEREDLGEWLATLKATRAAGRWKAVGVGLDKWEATRADLAKAVHAVLAETKAREDALADLIGRFGALRVKAQALGARADLLTLETQAREETRRSPCRLAQAQTAVAAFEAALARGRLA